MCGRGRGGRPTVHSRHRRRPRPGSSVARVLDGVSHVSLVKIAGRRALARRSAPCPASGRGPQLGLSGVSVRACVRCDWSCLLLAVRRRAGGGAADRSDRRQVTVEAR